jgi:hypothetical protein
MAMGPVQVLVVGYGEDARFEGKALDELKRLRDADIVRVVDLLMVRKSADGTVDKVELTDSAELEKFGAFAGALIGYGAAGEEGADAGAAAGADTMADEGSMFDEDEVWYLVDAIPVGMAAAVVVLEHRWAIPLRNAILESGGIALADSWIHPADLMAIGAEIGLED